MRQLDVSKLKALVTAIFEKVGVCPEQAQIIAQTPAGSRAERGTFSRCGMRNPICGFDSKRFHEGQYGA